MKINIITIHLKEGPKAKNYALKKIKSLSKYHNRIENINVKLIGKITHRGQEKDYYCELSIHIPNHHLEITDVERNIDKAIDKAMDKAKKSLIRAKEKDLSRKHKAAVLLKATKLLRN